MALYLDSETIEAAIEGLAASGVASTLTDYLIFKRAFVIARDAALANGQEPPEAVTTGTSSPAFVTAISEFAATTAGVEGTDWDGQPFFSPFGASRDKARGFKSKKYPSNGPSDTVGGWQSRPGRPLQIVEGTSPKQYLLVDRSREELTEYFRPSSASEPLPSLLDLAVWWHRFTDLEDAFGHEPTEAELIQATVRDFDLSPVEVEALFQVPNDDQEVDSAV